VNARLLFSNICPIDALGMDMSDTPSDFAAGIKPASHTRVTARESIFLGATVKFDDDPQAVPVRVRNISSGGMMIDSTVPRAAGLPLVAEIKNIGKIAGRVAWFEDRRMGIVFNRQIDPSLARLKVIQPAPKAAKPLFPV
jgi:PilZ domain